MRGMPYSRATRTADTASSTNPIVNEALAIQAANRPAKSAPREMPITPTLPRMPKPKRRRRAD